MKMADIDPDGVITEYEYDQRGNLTQIKHAGAVLFAYEYDDLNRLTATHYQGTVGGGKASLIAVQLISGKDYRDEITISWEKSGDWTTGCEMVTIQYSTNGMDWFNIATVDAAAETYLWGSETLNETFVQIRFIRPDDEAFLPVQAIPFRVLNGSNYYVNDNNSTDDEYCQATGRPYNGPTITGLTPNDPVTITSYADSNAISYV